MSRTTVADVLFDGLVRAGTPRVFGAAGAGESLLEAAGRRGLEVLWAEGAAAACIMAAVTGELGGAPGAVLAGSGPGLESAIPGLDHARHDRAPLIVLTEGAARARSLLAPLTKASLGVDPASAGLAIAPATRLALSAPRGPVHPDLAAGAPPAGTLLARGDLIVPRGVEAVEVDRGPGGANILQGGEAPPDGAPYRPVAQVVGEIGLVIAELAPRLRGRVRADWDVAELDRLKRSRRPRPAIPVPGLSARRVAEIVRQAAAGGTIAAVDAGQEMLAVAAAWDVDAPNEFLASNRLATTGFALPAAIAAQLTHRERRVVCFTGPPGLAQMARNSFGA